MMSNNTDFVVTRHDVDMIEVWLRYLWHLSFICFSGAVADYADRPPGNMGRLLLLRGLHIVLHKNWWLGSLQGTEIRNNDGIKMNKNCSQFSTVSKGVSTKPNIPDNPRNAWTEERDGKYNDKEMETLLQVSTYILNEFYEVSDVFLSDSSIFRSRQ